ncbi:hypothetical protein [Crateriforma conspicua]|uniref:Uncharacterized protein n=1 Tax=Crateriforma conspicua TaxID=2527996 RepID=A0A5C6FYW5_9PLAN|nr:hypothetical protein [Crateriforma conspicua]TWU67556.1 hypothetical protein V7x_31300 [Crateriforma conspicua]
MTKTPVLTIRRRGILCRITDGVCIAVGLLVITGCGSLTGGRQADSIPPVNSAETAPTVCETQQSLIQTTAGQCKAMPATVSQTTFHDADPYSPARRQIIGRLCASDLDADASDEQHLVGNESGGIDDAGETPTTGTVRPQADFQPIRLKSAMADSPFGP